VWLAPLQVSIVPVSVENPAIVDYCNNVKSTLWKENRIRVRLDDSTDTLSYKIRQSQKQKIPYTLVIGEKEVESNSVSVRKLRVGDTGAIPLPRFVETILEEIRRKTTE
jgi:threonyl-tRNA synthetase